MTKVKEKSKQIQEEVKIEQEDNEMEGVMMKKTKRTKTI